MKMDYVVVTLFDVYLNETIASIKKQPNVNRIIVVQAKRGAIMQQRMLQSMLANGVIDVLLYEDEGLAYARWLGIQEVQTEYFVFVDGDVVLDDVWFDVMKFHLDAKTEFVDSGIEIHQVISILLSVPVKRKPDIKDIIPMGIEHVSTLATRISHVRLLDCTHISNQPG